MSKAALVAENLALRQQLAILLREKKRPRFTPRDRLFWVLLSHFWPNWRKNRLEAGVRRLEARRRPRISHFLWFLSSYSL